ncbi:MAG: hypothetical protein COB14_06805 [Alphaproteobacteria bacterium]|nr:MAG: hypothetical protein COB14_06805 [Alphaproteobacteria bacterium]
MLMKIGGMVGARASTGNASPTAHLFLSIGNSHNMGRDTALGGDIFPANVWQWTQGGALAQPVAAQLDHVDENADEFAVDLTFAQDYTAANPAVDRIVFVPHADRSTGFSSGDWAYTDTPNRLSEAVARYEAAYTYLVAQGFDVVHAGIFYHSSNPDYNDSDHATHRDDIDGLFAYLRTNLTGGAGVPIVIGGGMNATQFSGRPTNDANFQANLLGAERRNQNVAIYDMINPRFGYSAGLPVAQFDSFHADRAGDITKGHLRYNALLRAALNTNPQAPFDSLTSWSFWKAFHDFRSGTERDLSGNANHLTQKDAVTNPALIKYDSAVEELVYDRDAGGTDRYWQAGAVLGTSYTKSVFMRFDSLDTQGLMQNSGGGTRMFLSSGSSALRVYHGSSANRVEFSNTNITVGQYYLVTATYDAVATTMKLYLDGALMDTNTNVANHALVSAEYIGAQNGSGAGQMDGAMMFAAYLDGVLELATVQELNTAAQGLVV